MRAKPIIVLILLIAAGLRFHHLGAQSFWNDEGSSYVQATRSFTEIATNAAADIHPPGYYWALKVWRSLTGDTEFALRYFSALAGVLTVAFTFGAGQRLFPYRRFDGKLAGLVAAGLVTLNTFSIFYAQEARMYALLGMWGAASLWVLLGFFQHPTWVNSAVLSVINALGLWTQYAFPLVMLAQGLAALLWLLSHPRKGRALRVYVVSNALAIALFAPLLPTALRQVTTWPSTGVDVLFPEALGTVMGWLAFGITYLETDSSWIAVMLILGLFGLRNSRSGTRAFVPALYVILPVGIFVGAGLFREGNIKFLLPSQVGFALAVAQGVPVIARIFEGRKREFSTTAPTVQATRASRKPSLPETFIGYVPLMIALLATAGIFWYVAWAVPPLYTNPAYFRDDYRAIVQTITPPLDSDDVIILNAPGQIEVFNYYYEGEVEPLRIPFGLNDTDEQIERATQRAIQSAEDIFLVLWGDAERDPNRIVERTLDAHAFEVSNTWYGDVRLARYATEAQQFDFTNNPNARFGNKIVLDKFAINGRELSAGDVLQVRLFWRAGANIDERYKITLQLLDEDGNLVVQRDAEPGGGTSPTDEWQMGERITDNHALLIPTNTGKANFTLIIALYNASDSTERLPISTSQNDYLTLTTIITEANSQ